MNPLRLARAIAADVLLAFAAWCDRVDTALADACNSEEDES